jgi:integrase
VRAGGGVLEDGADVGQWPVQRGGQVGGGERGAGLGQGGQHGDRVAICTAGDSAAAGGSQAGVQVGGLELECAGELDHHVHGLVVPTKKVEPLPLPAPRVRALADAQVRTVKNVLDRIEGFHQLNGRRHRGGGQAPAVHRHARPLRDRAIVHLILGTGLRRAEITSLDLAQLDPADPAGLRRVKARLNDVRGKGRTSRSVFLGRDARHALADYLEAERPGDADEQSEALFLAASSIAARRPGGRLSPRSVNTIVGEIGRIHDAETADRDRHLGGLRPHDLRRTFGYRLSEASGHNRAELERRLGHANDRYLRLYTNPPDDIAAGYVEDL